MLNVLASTQDIGIIFPLLQLHEIKWLGFHVSLLFNASETFIDLTYIISLFLMRLLQVTQYISIYTAAFFWAIKWNAFLTLLRCNKNLCSALDSSVFLLYS